MSQILKFEHRPDGTTALMLEGDDPGLATPLPRALIVDGHHPSPHADVLTTISWLAWPRYFSGTIAFGGPVSAAMGRALKELPAAFTATPYAIDAKLGQRLGGSTSLLIDSDSGFSEASNRLGEARALRLHVLGIDHWRGQLLSPSSIHVSANTKHFADRSWPLPGSDLPTRLAVALLFVDSLDVGKLIVSDESPDPMWSQSAEQLLECLNIDLVWTDAPARKALPL